MTIADKKNKLDAHDFTINRMTGEITHMAGYQVPLNWTDMIIMPKDRFISYLREQIDNVANYNIKK